MKSRKERAAEKRASLPSAAISKDRKERALASLRKEGRVELLCRDALDADVMQSALINAINRVKSVPRRARSKRSRPTPAGKVRLLVYLEDPATAGTAQP
jgi:hypothetical protein